MKTKFWMIVLFFACNMAYSQVDVTFTTLDSFTTNGLLQIGVNNLSATNHNGQVHLAYFYTGEHSKTWLLYSVRTTTGIEVDTIAEIPKYNGGGGGTAIQFGQDGEVWVYAGFVSDNVRLIRSYIHQKGIWEKSLEINQGGSGDDRFVAAAPHAGEIGFVFSSGVIMGPVSPTPFPYINYAAFNGNSWKIDTISDRKRHKTKRSIVSHNDKVFLTFAEGVNPDTIIGHVYVKEGDKWTKGFEKIQNHSYGGGGVLGMASKLGEDDDGVYLLLDYSAAGSKLQFFKNTDDNWTEQSLNLPSYSISGQFGPRGSNIKMDRDHTAYWISQAGNYDLVLSFIRSNGDAGRIIFKSEWPANIMDLCIIQDEIYIYFADGDSNWPYGKPVRFREAKIRISDIVSLKEPDIPGKGLLHQNMPNPAAESTMIQVDLRENNHIDLFLTDASGRRVLSIFKGEGVSGKNTYRVSTTHLQTGIYFYTLLVGDQVFTKKMVVAR